MNNTDALDGQACPSFDQVLLFLQGFLPAIHLLSIAEDGGYPIGSYFGDRLNDAASMAVAWNDAKRNVYFTVNEPSRDCGHKPNKLQIVRIRFAHVDIDPPKDHDTSFDKCAVIESLKADSPTLIVDSGNGIHAYWRLRESIEANAETIERIEGVNRALIQRYSGDRNAFNVDRILRVAGTVNWPDAKKRSMGRTPCMSQVIYG